MRISLQDSLPIFFSPPPPLLRHLRCSQSLQQQQQQQWSWSARRLVCSSSTSGPVPLSHPNLPGERPRSNRSRRFLTRYICSTWRLTGRGALKKGWFSFLCMFSHSVCVFLCVCVYVCTPLKAACAPLFQMTLFTDITQPPQIPRQNLISRENHSRDSCRQRFFFSFTSKTQPRASFLSD